MSVLDVDDEMCARRRRRRRRRREKGHNRGEGEQRDQIGLFFKGLGDKIYHINLPK